MVEISEVAVQNWFSRENKKPDLTAEQFQSIFNKILVKSGLNPN